MSRSNLVWLFMVPAFILTGWAVTQSAPPPSKEYKLMRTLVDVLAEVETNYVKELSDEQKQKLIENMINGGLYHLDKHSQYFNEEDLKSFNTISKGQFGGVGMMLTREPDRTPYLVVESPMPGTPAYEAGIQSGDIIVKVKSEKGEKSTEGMSVEDARLLIIGDPETKVTLTIRRDGSDKDEDVVLTRANIVTHPIQGVSRKPDDETKWEFMADRENKIALIRLTIFSEQSDKELREAIAEVEKQGAQALILDLRDNPGGLLPQAISISNMFLTEGTIVSTQNRNGIGRVEKAKAGNAIFDKKPMAVLVNRDSASASEILAAALQDNERAAVVGERSYGKGSVQKIFNLNENKAAVKLTTELWLTPKGKNIHKQTDSKETDDWGVRPDAGMAVPLTDDQRREYYKHLIAIDRSRGKNPKNKKDAPKQEDVKKDEGKKDGAKKEDAKPYVDPTVEKALQYLRTKVKGLGAAPFPPRAAV